MFDTIDVFTRLKKEFPHVNFEIRRELNKFKSPENRFYLTSLLNQNFETPIKTNIVITENQYLTESEYYVIYKNMFESFNKRKLLGLN